MTKPDMIAAQRAAELANAGDDKPVWCAVDIESYPIFRSFAKQLRAFSDAVEAVVTLERNGAFGTTEYHQARAHLFNFILPKPEPTAEEVLREAVEEVISEHPSGQWAQHLAQSLAARGWKLTKDEAHAD